MDEKTDPLEEFHRLLHEHGWEGKEAPPYSFRNMWFWTKPGLKPVEFITHVQAFPKETLGSHWRWRIEKADFMPGGTCMELGKLARDRRRHTVASLQRRLKQLDKVRMPVRKKAANTHESKLRAEDEAKRRAEIDTLERMLTAMDKKGSPPTERSSSSPATALVIDSQDSEVRRILTAEFLIDHLSPTQKHELKALRERMTDEEAFKEFLARCHGNVEAFIQHRVAQANQSVMTPGSPTSRTRPRLT